MEPEKIWHKIQEYVKLQISSANYKAWFNTSTKIANLTDVKLTIYVPSAFIKGQLLARYDILIKQAAEQATGHTLEIEYIVNSSLFNALTEEDSSDETDYFQFAQPQAHPTQITNLNPKFTLENFVVGLTNNLAFAAAQAVVQNPGTTYNPLFIYGPSGVGKTHLMHAIGNAIVTNHPYTKLMYVTSERFMNDFVDSIQNKKSGDFRARYRNCNLLLVDDIQFISGKDSTQEEFFHTFNELTTKNSQIVLTADRPPNEIQKLESRLASRFQGGLMVDIQLPDFDTRVAILKAKLNERGEVLPEEYLKQIAETVTSNSRELEGKLVQILQAVKLLGQEPNPELIQRYLGQQTVHSSVPDSKKVLSTINQYFNIRMEDITGPRRQKELVLPRQIAMYVLHEDCRLPLEKVGALLGGRDHSTILHGVDKIRLALNRDREIQRLIIEVRQNLSN